MPLFVPCTLVISMRVSFETHLEVSRPAVSRLNAGQIESTVFFFNVRNESRLKVREMVRMGWRRMGGGPRGVSIFSNFWTFRSQARQPTIQPTSQVE